MNRPHRTLARRIAAMALLALECAGAPASERACDADWDAPAAPRLVRLDVTSAALVQGSLVLARARFDPPALLQAMQPTRPLQATFEPQAEERHWRVRGSVVVDDECTLSLDAEVVLEPASPGITRAGRALELFGAARQAAEAAQPERAADLAQSALDVAGDVAAQPVLGATIAGFTIDRLIEQRQLGRARQLADNARRQWAGKLDPGQPAALRFELGAVRLLAWPEALNAREQLQARLDATFGSRSLPALENRVRRANALTVLGRDAAALVAYQEVEAILASDARPAPALRILLARSIATALALQGRPDAQITRLQALRDDLVRRYGTEDRRVIDVDDDIARGLGDEGRLHEALVLVARVFLWRDRELGPAHPRTLESARLLALLYGRSGRYASARTLLEEVLRRIDPEADTGLTIRVWRDIATWAALDGEPLAALDLMGKAHRAARAQFSADSVFTVGLAIDYGWLLLRAGDTAAGCALLDSVREHAPAAAGLREWANAGYARCLLASERADAAAPQRAIDLLRTCVDDAAAAVGLANPRALIWQALLASAELRAGRRAEAKQRLAMFVLRAERNREAYAVGSALRDTTFGMWVAEDDSRAGYRTLALLYAQDGDLDEAVRITELARDRQLRDRFAERRFVQVGAGVPAVVPLRALQARRQALDESIAVADIGARVRLEAERVEVADEIDRLERSLAAHFPAQATAVTPTVAAIQARLPADMAMVAYQRAGSTWWISVIDRQNARLVPVRDGSNVAVAARAWARSVRGEPVRVWESANGAWTLAFVRPAQAVARVPIARVVADLGNTLLGGLDLGARIRRLVVVADDELVGLPLDALRVGASRLPALTRYEVTYAASFGGWIELRDRTDARVWQRDLLAVGAIDSGPSEPATGVALAARAAALRGGWAPLPFARNEIEHIARLFPATRVRTLLDRDASKSAIVAASRSGELARYRYVHFATHARVEPAFAERAALVLAGEGGGDAELTATELAGLTMNAEVVVLSACDSGVGRYEHGQGVLGFAFAALAAGNRAAVLSLWPVADDTTAEFMRRFYARMRAGAAPAAALARTRREFFRSSDPRKADPRVWAAFVLYGTS